MESESPRKEPLASSFRDPSGFMYTEEGELFRQINRGYAEEYDLLMSSGLYKTLTDAKLLIPHEELADSERHSERGQGSEGDQCYKVIKPERVRSISYPYEWSYSQLKDAALTTMKIQRLALKYGMVLKDASAYNIQFHQGRPMFIDTLSFARYNEGEPWVAYKQYCQHFLAPLALASFTDFRLAQLSKNYIDGVPLDLASRLLPRRSYLNYSILVHIHLHARVQMKYSDSGSEASQKTKSQSITRKAFVAFLLGLYKATEALQWKQPATEWGQYYAATNYEDQAMQHKESLVAEYLKSLQPSELAVHDLGANTGRFSRVAAGLGFDVVSQDIDPVAVESNYLQTKKNKEKNLLPLLLDLTNPSPAIGWSLAERMSFAQRVDGKIVLALALIHHMAISNNIPLPMIAKHFSQLSAALIIEFVPKSDSQVQRLLASRIDIFDNYDQPHFESAFSEYFLIRESESISSSERTLYLMTRK